MGIEFASPLLLASARKLNGAAKEIERVNAFAEKGGLTSEDAIIAWGAMTAIAASVHNAYNGIEDVMRDICRNVDDFVPGGSSWHQDIIEQMAAPRKGVRPAVVTDELRRELMILKGFRHVVNHNYAMDLDPGKVQENLDRLNRAFPQFRDALVALDDHLSAEPEESSDISDPFGSGR